MRCFIAPLLAALALSLAGCGGAGPTAADGTAQLWVTRDRGSQVLVDAEVPAGQTLLRALRSQAKVSTRYGGGFVQSINGVEGSARHHEDWFWFVNGLAGDRSATSYRLRKGDVAWWDYRDWSGDAATLEVVAGAFPEPFVHGYDGKVRPAAVRYAPGLREGGERIAKAIGANDVAPLGTLGSRVPRMSSSSSAALPASAPGCASREAGRRAPWSSRSPARSTQLLAGTYARRFSIP